MNSGVTIQKNTKAKSAAKPTPPPVNPNVARAQKAAATRKANIAAKAAGTAPAPSTASAAENTKRVSRKHLAEVIHEKLKAAGKGVPTGICEIAVVAVEEAIAESLAGGNEVQLPGFGKFIVAAKDARTGRNPKTGEAVEIAAFNQVRFKVGANLKKAVNGGVEVAANDE